MKKLYFYFLCIIHIYTISCLVFPKCDELLPAKNDRVNCLYCWSHRVYEECKELCRASGCRKDDTTSTSVTDLTTTDTTDVEDVISTIGRGKEFTEAITTEQSNKKNVKKVNQTLIGNDENVTQNRSRIVDPCDSIEPCVEINVASAKFKARCLAKGLEERCAAICKYNITKNEAQDAFLHHRCELREARRYLLAAADDKDNTYCCNKTDVLYGDRSICEPFCNPSSSQWPKKADGKYLKCIPVFSDIIKCHWAANRL